MSRVRLAKATIALGDMTCGHCTATVEKALLSLDGVSMASADLPTQSADVEYDPSAVALPAMEAAVAAVGYAARPTPQLVSITSAAQAVRDTAATPPAEPRTVEYSLAVTGMTCASCVRSVERAALEVPGVTSCEVSLAESTARVRLDEQSGTIGDVIGAIRGSGYGASVATATRAAPTPDGDSTALSRRLLVSAALTLPLLVLAMSHGAISFSGANWLQLALAAPVVAFGGAPFYAAAWNAARHGRSDMNTLIAVGTGAAFAYSVAATVAPGWLSSQRAAGVYFETAAAIITLVLLGRLLEAKARHRTSHSIRKLLDLQARSVRVRRDRREVEIPLEDVKEGDLVLVRPGERIPVDGEVVEGSGAVDEAPMTGESVPVDKAPGSPVVSGALNRDGFLVFRAESVGARTALSRVIEFVRRAQASKAPAARIADRIAAVFVPVILGVAAATFAAWMAYSPPEDRLRMALNSAVSVLIIACPCALGLATPAALAVGLGRAAEAGILVRDSGPLEAARSVDTVVFDKTGTLTLGQFSVTDVEAYGGLTPATMLRAASEVERHGEHPIAKAIAAASPASTGNVTEFRALPGAGASALLDGVTWLVGKPALLAERDTDVSEARETLDRLSGEGKTVVAVARDGTLAGVVALRDAIRPGVPEATADLRRMGIKTVLLSGDSASAARAAADEAGIQEVLAPVLPLEKAAAVRRIQGEGRTVAMVGDGINDAPALAQADLGVAIGAGTDIAIESAGIVLVKSDPADVGRAIELARRIHRTIIQNYCWAFGYNILGVPIAAGVLYPWTGLLLSPVLASVAMALSSLSVLTNSLRLNRVFRRSA